MAHCKHTFFHRVQKLALSSSLNLNPLNYKLWNILEENCCAHRHHNLESLKKSIIKSVYCMSLEVISVVIDDWSHHLHACIAVHSCHFEQSLYRSVCTSIQNVSLQFYAILLNSSLAQCIECSIRTCGCITYYSNQNQDEWVRIWSMQDRQSLRYK